MESKSKVFWEGIAKEVGHEYTAESAVMLTSNKLWAEYRDKIEKKHLFQNVKFNKSMSVLDLGCGAGRWSFEFALRCQNVVAVDFSPTFIEIAKKRAIDNGFINIDFFCQSIMNFSYLSNRSFDVIFLGGVLQYLNDESVDSLIEKLYHHSKNGIIVISRDTLSIKNHSGSSGKYPCIYRTQKELVEIFIRNRFSHTCSHENMFPPLTLIFYDSLPEILKKGSLPFFKATLSLLVFLNDSLQEQGWLYSLFLNKLRKTFHMFNYFEIKK